MKNEEPARMLVVFFSSVSISISGAVSSRMIPKNFLTGMVVAPGFLTVPSTEHETVTSKSVAVNSTFPSVARTRTLERMGSVVRVLTTF